MTDIPETLWTGKCAGHLLARGQVRVRTSTGDEYEISETEDGHLKVWARGGGNLFSTNEAGNVMAIVNWPNFQPIVPPTKKRPVIASREHIMSIVTAKHNGMASKCQVAVQKALDRNPELKALLEKIVKETLDVKSSPHGGEEIIVRGSKK